MKNKFGELLKKAVQKIRDRGFSMEGVAIDDMQRRWNWDAIENGAAPFPGLHVGRNTLATFLVQQRVPIERVSKILRHASIATTARFYAHLSPLDCRDELQKFPI